MPTHRIFAGCNCTRGIAANIREELWSYFALSGLLFLNIGIVLMVYALKKATTHPTVMEVCGIGLIVLGVTATLASWYVHRQHRQRKPLFSCAYCCCRDSHTMSSEDLHKTSTNGSLHVDYRTIGSRLPKRENYQRPISLSEHTFGVFSTIEFQTYAEYVKRDNVGVQGNETRKNTRKNKGESQRQKIQVHPQRPGSKAQAAMFVNAIYSHKSHIITPPIKDMSPSLVKFS